MIVHNNLEKITAIVAMVKEHFGNNSVLAKELQLYKSLLETDNLDLYTAEKLLFESRRQHASLNKKRIFNEQSALISKIS